MSRGAPLPAEVEAVLRAFRDGLETEGAPALRGLYLVGSLALSDYRPGASDIDFVALLDSAPSAEAVERLARVHARLTTGGGPLLDGVYLPAGLLRQPAPGEAAVPFSVDGRLRTDRPCREASPVVWRCLARNGRTVLGIPPSELGIADDDATLRAHQLTNLHGYWRDWIADAETALNAKAPGDDANAAALAWGVLGVSRIACTLATGTIVSKREAGAFGLRTDPPSWHPVLAEALSIHRSGPERVPVTHLHAALAYMRFVIDQAPGYQP
ncbi:aminoglycoside adenylyltransferase domain-containing protein [Methylobacterium sp. Leaf118]|uniref:aminoglycoside adenylyltransferase domain-containing protein n=1 Tax=Methylobacterium sp. Leaf118 TaxID=2876562 RepID=UPI001E38A798|nr:aminoglycoside adenylyltransferase domain-containing protein [Methylobacterium sp. Leaf118]